MRAFVALPIFSRRSVLDWKREIAELARQNPPLLDDEEAGLIEEALKDKTRLVSSLMRLHRLNGSTGWTSASIWTLCSVAAISASRM